MLYERMKIEPVQLHRGEARCEILPQLGGAIAAWSVGGQAMLRPAGADSIAEVDPFGMGSFPLVPYSNRIGNGEFAWAGTRHALARNFVPEPHAIHGVGFENPWDVADSSANAVTLHFVHRPGAGWPWPFEAQQRIVLESQNVLAIDMQAKNLATQPVPLAFGHHPYFPRAGASLQFHAQSVWLVDSDGLPSLQVKPFDKFDYSRLRPVSQGDIDHCFSRWDGRARIEWPDRPFALEIRASPNLPHAVVCIRSDLDGFCFEPVPHVNNALNRREPEAAMPVIEPGESFAARIEFAAVDR